MNAGWIGGLAAALVLASCASAPGPRLMSSPVALPDTTVPDFELPSPTWPLKTGLSARPLTPPARAALAWTPPRFEAPPVAVVPAAIPLPLPEARPLPLKSAPASRSWAVLGQAAPAPTTVPPAPSLPALPKSAAKTAAKTETKPDAKTPPTASAVPAPAAPVPATAPPTAAATAQLLPVDKTKAPDYRYDDVNAVAGDAVTLHFDKTNWLYLDTPAQQKAVGFQSISRDKASTTFVFRPQTPGVYTLEFQRQDLSQASTDRRQIVLNVVAAGTRTVATGSVLSPQTSTVPPNDPLEASRLLATQGKTSEAVQKLLQSYRADDARTNLELARLLNQNGQDDEALGYLDRNMTLTGPDLPASLILGTRLAATRDAQKKLPAYVKLWAAGTTAPPEDLYVQVLDTLRQQKLLTLAKDWSARYTAWYREPQLRDQYLYALGQVLEEPGDTRDLRGAWKAYDEVVQSFPLSPFWKAAGERAAYINRHFLQVR